MAVYQISRIQVRRGKKDQGTGLPQLASGELAWAIDTQELFIGNGSVGEGAPYVGNTKLLTEHDSLLSLLEQYQYRVDQGIQTSGQPNYPTRRSLQHRLDEGSVNARSFGIIPNTTEDQYENIQHAITTVASTLGGIILEFDPGTYQISQGIILPDNVRLKGSGKDITVFQFTSNSGSILSTENDSRNNILSDFSILIGENNSDTTFIDLRNTIDSKFFNISLVRIGASPTDYAANNVGINLTADSMLVFRNNVFSNIEFKNITQGITSNTEIFNNIFDQCYYYKLVRAISLGANTLPNTAGPINNVFSNSIFEAVRENAILVDNGYGNKSRNNTFYNVGNLSGGVSTNMFSIIKFNIPGNTSLGDTFDRTTLLSTSNAEMAYIPEIEGPAFRHSYATNKISLITATEYKEAIRLPLNINTDIEIPYVFSSEQYNQTRAGVLQLTVDRLRDVVQLTDSYNYVGEDNGDNNVTFSASLEEANGITAVVVSYINLNQNDANSFTYTYSSLS